MNGARTTDALRCDAAELPLGLDRLRRAAMVERREYRRRQSERHIKPHAFTPRAHIGDVFSELLFGGLLILGAKLGGFAERDEAHEFASGQSG